MEGQRKAYIHLLHARREGSCRLTPCAVGFCLLLRLGSPGRADRSSFKRMDHCIDGNICTSNVLPGSKIWYCSHSRSERNHGTSVCRLYSAAKCSCTIDSTTFIDINVAVL